MTNEFDIQTVLGTMPGTDAEHAADLATLADIRDTPTRRLERWLSSDRHDRTVTDICISSEPGHDGLYCVALEQCNDEGEDFHYGYGPTIDAALTAALTAAECAE